MKLQGRNLSIGMSGDDVLILQGELLLLDYPNLEAEMRQKSFGAVTQGHVRDFLRKHGLKEEGVVDETVASLLTAVIQKQPMRLVLGRITYPDGKPVASAKVEAGYNSILAFNNLSGDVADRDGDYTIPYSIADFTDSQKKLGHLLVRVPTAPEQTVGRTGFGDPAVAIINIQVIPRGYVAPSEFRRLLDAATPLLTQSQTSLAKLSQDEAAAIAKAVGLDQQQFSLLVIAHQLINEPEVVAMRTLSAEHFYGLLRQGLPTKLDDLAAQSRDRLVEALTKSIQERIVFVGTATQALPGQTADWVKELQADRTIKTLPGSQPTMIQQLLRLSITDNAKQKDFAKDYLNHAGSPADFWKELSTKPDFSAKAAEIKEAFDLHSLTQDNLQLATALKQSKIGVREAAGLDENGWRELITDEMPIPATVPGSNREERVNNYVKQLPKTFGKAHPTGAFLGTMGRVNLPETLKTDFQTFFQRNSSFELGQTRINDYLARTPNAFAGIANPVAFERQLRGANQAIRFAGDTGKGALLIREGLSSFGDIAMLSVNQLSSRMPELPKAEVLAMNREARRLNTVAAGVNARYAPQYNQTDLYVTSSMTALAKRNPDFEALFGSLDFCSCEHCKSVYSPAAYLVDILHFLHNRGPKPIFTYEPNKYTRKRIIDDLQAQTLPPEIQEQFSMHGLPLNAPRITTIFTERESSRSVWRLTENQYDLLIKREDSVFEAFRQTGGDPKGVLFERRPDLGEIELTCENTNTPMPYVDLVNEVLENAIAPSATRTFQTTASAKELAANPQYINDNAYQILKNAIYPFSLPFDLRTEEARVYLNHLGIKRHELMKAFRNPSNTGDAARAEALAIAGEYLGIGETERKIILNDPPRDLELWGLEIGGKVRVKKPDTLDEYESLDWQLGLGHVRVLLDRSGLSYEELTNLLKAKYITTDGSLSISSKVESDPFTCDTIKLVVKGLVQDDTIGIDTLRDRFSRFARFVRLWRKLGWKMEEVDLAILKLGVPPAANPDPLSGEAGEDLFLKLSHVQMLRDEFRLSVEQVLAFWTDINNEGENSLYRQLFLNPAIINPVNDALRLTTSATISGNASTIMAALRLTDTEWNILKDVALPTGNDGLTLSNLSSLYRVILLARQLQLSISDFETLIGLSETYPFDVTETQDTLRFIEIAHKIRASGFSVPELNYLLRHQRTANRDEAPDEAALVTILGNLRRTIRTTLSEAMVNGELTVKTLSLLGWDEPMIKQVMDTFKGNVIYETDLGVMAVSLPDELPDSLKGLLSHDTTTNKLRFLGPMRPSQRVALRTVRLSSETNPDPETAIPIPEAIIQLLFDQPRTFIREQVRFPDGSNISFSAADVDQLFNDDSNPGSRFSLLLAKITPLLITTTVKQHLSEALSLEPSLLSDLITSPQRVTSALARSRPALQAFIRPAFIDSNINIPVSKTSDAFLTLVKLHKIARLISKLGIGADQLHWLFTANAGATWLNLNSLPHQSDTARNDRFDRFITLLDLFALLSSSEEGRYTESRLIDVEGILRTKAKDIASIKEQNYLLNKSGSSREQCLSWAMPTISPDAANAAKLAAKSRYETDQWLKIAKPLRDVLREKQRAALVAYLLAHPQIVGGAPLWESVNDLYAYFLIDMEMSACMMTSRIKQAACSVQLFVQRCLMNLESEVTVNSEADDDWLQWKWMKNYRVWEANRKVFCYPENWLEPELRDDKSPFFKELEEELLQNDITSETAEAAFRSYLEKLGEVARLEIVGQFLQEKDPNNSESDEILHVFGRTHSKPHRYFYCRWVNRKYWTAWEEVIADIEGDHIIPAVWNNRLYLFWAIFTEKSTTPPPPTVGQTEMQRIANSLDRGTDRAGSPARNEKEVQMAYIAFNSGHWGEKRFLSKINLGSLYPHLLEFLFISISEEEDHLTILCSTLPAAEPDNNFSVVAEYHIDHSLKEILAENGNRSSGKVKIHPAFGRRRGMFFLIERPRLNNTIGRVAGEWPAYAGLYLKQHGEVYILYHNNIDEALPFRNRYPWFFQDDKTTFFVEPLHSNTMNLYIYYHPFASQFIGKYLSSGVKGVINKSTQLFKRLLDLTPHPPYPTDLGIYGDELPTEHISFDLMQPYALYNWEIFFHIPLLVANSLSQNNRFEEAQEWYHYIFNPTDTSSAPAPQKFWQMAHFFQTEETLEQEIREILEDLAGEESGALQTLHNQVEQWRDNPFNPHLIARLRTVAYQKAVVMKYIENLINWGDQLFRQDTIESINEATQLYILAAEILGRRPEKVTPRHSLRSETYNSVQELLSAEREGLGNPVVTPRERIEEMVLKIDRERFATRSPLERHRPGNNGPTSSIIDGGLTRVPPPQGQTAPIQMPLLFCVPHNEKLLGYWDLVADRLFKIRHCRNIEGVLRQLSLFDLPIDPSLLIKARTAGIDISSVMDDSTVPLPHYRFNVMAQKANELCSEVKSLGAALLSALEKRDAEDLALLRSRHEIGLLKAIRTVKSQQVTEAEHTLNGQLQYLEMVKSRFEFYSSREFMNPLEFAQFTALTLSQVFKSISSAASETATVSHLVPNAKLGAPTSIGVTYGGENVGNSSDSLAESFKVLSEVLEITAHMTGTLGEFQRRQEEWNHQAELASMEIEQVGKQIAAAEIRLAIAEKELQNHDKQIENAKEVDDLMRSKFTNKQLYNWMVGQLSTLYFQSYKLAYDIAKRAERGYRYELGVEDSNFIQFGYWDSLKKGLLAGERLSLDLKRMEVAYLDQNRREYEITKHISLTSLNPLAFITLKETGICEFKLPEELFDTDYPGHYLRRIKSVSLTVPCVTGPYTNINCTLRLHSSKIRKTTELPYVNDDRFISYRGSSESIATSNAQNDSGMFELNFRDERYLPFEGMGAVASEWRLEMPKESNSFDFNTISDAVIHLRYTARDGGEQLKKAAIAQLETIRTDAQNTKLARLFSLRHEMPDHWHELMNTSDTIQIKLENRHFPFLFRDRFKIRSMKAKIGTTEYPMTNSANNPDTQFFEVKLAAAVIAQARSSRAEIFVICEYYLKPKGKSS